MKLKLQKCTRMKRLGGMLFIYKNMHVVAESADHWGAMPTCTGCHHQYEAAIDGLVCQPVLFCVEILSSIPW
jgi:hypothetical protein